MSEIRVPPYQWADVMWRISYISPDTQCMEMQRLILRCKGLGRQSHARARSRKPVKGVAKGPKRSRAREPTAGASVGEGLVPSRECSATTHVCGREPTRASPTLPDTKPVASANSFFRKNHQFSPTGQDGYGYNRISRGAVARLAPIEESA